METSVKQTEILDKVYALIAMHQNGALGGENKKQFPYLSGTKICNYWLYIIHQYTDRTYQNIGSLTVAPDTHVCKATHRLGLISDTEFASGNVQQIVINRWQKLLQNTGYNPIDVHTPLWLWSRNGFPALP